MRRICFDVAIIAVLSVIFVVSMYSYASPSYFCASALVGGCLLIYNGWKALSD